MNYHADEEWNQLSHEQRMKILEARGTKRTVNSISVHDDESRAISAVTTPAGLIDAEALQE